jgi:hypothetical protein
LEANEIIMEPKSIGFDADSPEIIEHTNILSTVSQKLALTETEDARYDQTLIASSTNVSALEKEVSLFTCVAA